MNLDIEIENYRSIRKSHLVLKSGLNVLVGPNGSGKTNVLSALKFLRDVLENGAALAMGKAGGAIRNYHRGKREIIFRARAEYGNCIFDSKRTPFEFVWEIRIAQRGIDRIPAVAHEEFAVYAKLSENKSINVLNIKLTRPESKPPNSSSYIIDEDRLGKDFFLQLNGKQYSSKKSMLFEYAKKSISEVMNAAKKEHDRTFLQSLSTLRPNVDDFIDMLHSLIEYNILPNSARLATDQVPEPRMRNDGEGVSEVIHTLKSRQFRRLFTSRFYYYSQRRPYIKLSNNNYYFAASPDSLRLDYRKLQQGTNPLDNIIIHLSAAVNAIDDLDTEIDPTTGRRYVVFKSGTQKFYPDEVSDGTIKWLCLLVAIFVPYSKTFLLEEPENFMHPWMQQRLVEIMREQSRTSNLIFLISTHSTTVLNSVSPDELLLVQQNNKGTLIKRLDNTKSINEFLDKSNFGLGDYWVSGGIGAVPGGGI